MAEDVVVRDPVKRPGQVRVEDPQAPGVLLGDLEDRFDRVMAATARPKSIGLRLKPRLPLGLQRVHDPCLVHAVDDHGDPERAPLLAARLGDVHPSDRHGLERVRVVVHPCDQFCLAFGVSATSPSTPAVRRPALRSVTRRTLNSVFERDRSINFCNRRTLGRSPAFDAVKIRWRNRRTFSSTCRQSIWRQSSVASSGPLTTTVVVASSLSAGSGVTVIFLFTGSPDRVSSLSRPGNRPGIRPVIHDPPAGGLASASRFPVAFRPPAFASRSSDTRRGVGPSSRSAYRTRPRARPDPDGVTTFRTHEQRPARAPSDPGDHGAHPGPRRLPARRLPLRSGQSLPPALTSHRRMLA